MGMQMSVVCTCSVVGFSLDHVMGVVWIGHVGISGRIFKWCRISQLSLVDQLLQEYGVRNF